MKRHGIILALTLLAATPAVAGPPWISIELPASPFSEARGAFLLVRTYHHGTPVQLVMQGTAEGLVNGARRSVPLEFTAMSQFGAFAVSRSWPSEGVWVLDIQSFDGHFAISAVVGVGASGEVSLVRVPLARSGAPRTVSRGESVPIAWPCASRAAHAAASAATSAVGTRWSWICCVVPGACRPRMRPFRSNRTRNAFSSTESRPRRLSVTDDAARAPTE